MKKSVFNGNLTPKGFRGLKGAGALAAALVAVLGASALLVQASGVSTVTFTCLPQAQAIALITANPPGGMSPDTSTCPGFFDGYYTPSAVTSTSSSTTSTTSTSTTSASTNVLATGVGRSPRRPTAPPHSFQRLGAPPRLQSTSRAMEQAGIQRRRQP